MFHPYAFLALFFFLLTGLSCATMLTTREPKKALACLAVMAGCMLAAVYLAGCLFGGLMVGTIR